MKTKRRQKAIELLEGLLADAKKYRQLRLEPIQRSVIEDVVSLLRKEIKP